MCQGCYKHSLWLPPCFSPHYSLITNYRKNLFPKNVLSSVLLFNRYYNSWCLDVFIGDKCSSVRKLMLHTALTKREGRLERRHLRWEAEYIGRTLSNALESFSAKVSSGAVRRREGERDEKRKSIECHWKCPQYQLITLKTDSYRGRGEQYILSLCNELYSILKWKVNVLLAHSCMILPLP